MKKKSNTHPKYQEVLFIDSASNHKFVCGSTMHPDATETYNGKSYPVVYLSISSTSHPFFTGSKQLVDSEGRVEKFRKRFERKKEEMSAEAAVATESVKTPEVKKSKASSAKKG